jgi:hypothetical protein
VLAFVALLAVAEPSTPAAPAGAAPPAAPPPAARPRDSLLVLDVAGVEQESGARGLSDLLATLMLERVDLDVVAVSSVRDRLAHATDKVQAGCDDAACMAEIAGAIGAHFVLYSRFSTAGDVKLLRLEVLDEKTARSAALVTVRSASTSDLYQELPKAVDELVTRSDGALPRLMHASPVVDAPGFFDHPGNGHLVIGGVLLAIGVGAGAGYGVSTYFAQGRASAVDDAVKQYIAAPSPGNAAALKGARDNADGLVSLQNVLAFTALPATLVGVLSGGVMTVVGLRERASEGSGE